MDERPLAEKFTYSSTFSWLKKLGVGEEIFVAAIIR